MAAVATVTADTAKFGDAHTVEKRYVTRHSIHSRLSLHSTRTIQGAGTGLMLIAAERCYAEVTATVGNVSVGVINLVAIGKQISPMKSFQNDSPSSLHCRRIR